MRNREKTFIASNTAERNENRQRETTATRTNQPPISPSEKTTAKMGA